MPLVLHAAVTLHVAASVIFPEYKCSHIDLSFGIFQWEMHRCIALSSVCVLALWALTFPSVLSPAATPAVSSTFCALPLKCLQPCSDLCFLKSLA